MRTEGSEVVRFKIRGERVTITMRKLLSSEFALIAQAKPVVAAMWGYSRDAKFFRDHVLDTVPFMSASSGLDQAAVAQARPGLFLYLLEAAIVANQEHFPAKPDEVDVVGDALADAIGRARRG